MEKHIYVAEVEEPELWGTTTESLIVFVPAEVLPPDRLHNPDVVSFSSADGCWSLLYFDENSGRAFYERTDDAGVAPDSGEFRYRNG